MKKPAIFVLLLLASIIFSCSGDKESEKNYRKEIDSLLTELRMMDDSLKTIEIQRVQYLNDSLRRFYDTAKISDTIDRRWEIYRRSRNIMDWYDNVNREINFSRSHLRSMKTKFKNTDLPDSSKNKELRKEKEIISSIHERFDEEYDGLRMEVEALLNRQSADE